MPRFLSLVAAIACLLVATPRVVAASAATPTRRAVTDRVALLPTRSGQGYWIVDANGAVVPFGDAVWAGDLGGQRLGQPIVAAAADASGGGYWLADATGGVFSFGDAPFLGSLAGDPLARPIVGMAATAHGYWLVAADGGVFTFGDAPFLGSLGAVRLEQPVVGMAGTAGGYWLVAADGGVFTFGDAPFRGARPFGEAVALVGAADGYWMLSQAGQLAAFGEAPQLGSDTVAPLAVATRTITVVDPTRPTLPRGGQPGHPGRTLPTTVYQPAGVGPFPLIVFAPGFDATPATYDVLLREWASDGYVVAAPEFPLSGAAGPGPPSEADLSQQPADMSAVITAVLNDAPVDAGEIAVAGQSDGGSTVAAMILDSAFNDPRINAGVVMSGAELPMSGGTYGNKSNVPLLVIQGDDDTSNRPADAQAVYNAARDPRAYLDVIGGGHLAPYLDATEQASLVRGAAVGFLDRVLRGEVDGRVRLERDGDASGLTALQSSLP